MSLPRLRDAPNVDMIRKRVKDIVVLGGRVFEQLIPEMLLILPDPDSLPLEELLESPYPIFLIPALMFYERYMHERKLVLEHIGNSNGILFFLNSDIIRGIGFLEIINRVYKI